MAPAAEAPGDQEVMPEPLGGTPQMLAQLPPAVVRNGVSNGVVEREAAGARQLPAQFQTQTPALPALPVVTGALRQAVGQSMVQMSAQSLVPVAGQSLAQVPMLSSAHSAQPATRAIPPATPPAAAPKMAASIAQQQQQQQPHAMVANFNRPATPAATPAATGTAAHASALSSSAVHPVQTSSAVQQQQQQQPSTAQPSAAVSQHAPTTQPTAHASTAAVTAATPAAKPSVAAAAAAAKPVHPRPASQTGRAGPADAERHGDAKAAGTRLSDGFIVLISIAIMFVCALLFYFYMRQRRRRAKRRALHHAAHGSLLHSHSSLSLPSGRGGGGGAGGDKFSRVLTRDSGTSLSLREPRTAGGGGAANDEKLFPIASLHDVHAAETLDRRYLDYRSGSGSGGGEKGVGTMAQSLVDARHARFGAERRVAGAISFDNVAPVRARLPPSPLQQQMQQPPVAAIPAYAGACSQRSLLDTSAANPALAAAAAATTGGAAGAGGGGVGGKPRKLVRDTFRGGNNSSSSNSGSSSPAGSPKQPGGKPSHGSSVKTMLRSLAPATPPPAARTAPRSPDAAADRPADRASPLLDSIESISDSYQFAVRHRPPLGPLRVVEPHVPALADELAVDRGHHMFVVGEFADGWVLAVNISRNSECGMIPRRCLFFPTAAFMTADAVAASA
ncbi:hypothetical protein LPJ53_001242 [Coemansia erecta]|uniref:SH3 domain-containing protein n=1 Tax=Coemansia erecta TaxID=147472 RepID=A0A9W7Y618_9FUNG|nr:hypothetical protein LPJ53_001242 [Coemansia erecta]